MKKLQSLQDALIALGCVARPEQIRGVVDSGKPIQSGKLTSTGVQVLQNEYECHLEIKKAAGDLDHLLAATMAWMIDSGEQYDEFTGWDGETDEDHTSTIELRFHFVEAVQLVPAPNGYTGRDRVLLGGKLYRVGVDVPGTATSLDSLNASLGT